jgi:NAD(P)-dependent dehydrogenase (short-subunit alcohol dehydrogenase family)
VVTSTIDKPFDLTGRTALVTGAARGLGRAIAVALADAGADVALGVRRPHTADDLVEQIHQRGRRVVEVALDVSDLAQVEAGVAQAVDALGSLDILVNNAGIAPGNNAEDVTEADFDATLAVNLKGTFFTSQFAARHMLEQGFGRIINVSSQAGLVALPGESVYCMTKAALIHLTKCQAVEWGPRGITVNAVAPTFIETPGTEPALSDPAFRADVEERIAALHRIGQPTDVANAVVFLASPAAALITGHTLVIDGGWTAR